MSLKKKGRGGEGKRRRDQKISVLASLPAPDSGPEKIKKKNRFKLAVYAGPDEPAPISTFLHAETASPAEDTTVCHLLEETSQTCRK